MITFCIRAACFCTSQLNSCVKQKLPRLISHMPRIAGVQRHSFYSAPPLSADRTVKEIISELSAKVGATGVYKGDLDRTHLLKLLPKSQDELPPRTMKDSYDRVLIPLSSDKRLREKYVTFMGGVRIGRLMEDMDVFAVWICYNHILNPRQTPDQPSPYSLVTALVDRIDFNQEEPLTSDGDLQLEGHVSWVGKSSLEVTLYLSHLVDGQWKRATRALFVMVARDPLNQGSAVINPLLCETEEEKKLQREGEIRKMSRKHLQEESLFRAPPNESEKSLVHDLFMSMAEPDQLSFAPKRKPVNSVWMEDTKLKNLIMCHPEHRNRFMKVFGGFIMRQAMEITWPAAFAYSKQRPRLLSIDDIMFRSPVEIGSLLYLNSQVVYTESKHLQISTKASVVDVQKQTTNLTNIFHFTFEVDEEVDQVVPKTYNEAMMYLDGRRHYQMVRGIRKFYGQGETWRDSPEG